MAKSQWLTYALPPNHPLADLAILPESDSAAVRATEGEFRLPDLSAFPTAVEKARRLLFMAAGVEHALAAQYLYSAYSITGSNLRRASDALRITAVEEMAHLMSVENLLLLVRGESTVKRVDRQSEESPSEANAPIAPFNLKFEPFSKTALAKYVVAEAPHNAAEAFSLYPKIQAIAGMAHHNMLQQVGALYLLLGVVFGDEETLARRASNGGWDERVKALADFIDDEVPQYGGREGVHLQEQDFAQSPQDEGFLSRRGLDIQWDRSKREAKFDVFAPNDRDEALDALREISLQGEGATGPSTDKSHFERFLEAFEEIYGPDGDRDEPNGVAPVPAAAAISTSPSSTDENAITHPISSKLARLADLRYAILLGALEQYLRSPPDDRDMLAAWCFSEMLHLRQLGLFLVARPRKSDSEVGQAVAAAPFNLPAQFAADQSAAFTAAGNVTAWPNALGEWFEEALQITDELLGQDGELTDGERVLLKSLQEVDPRKLAESVARRNGETIRTTFDEVREIMDWAAGVGEPRHGGTGRFWNRPHEVFTGDDRYGPEDAIAELEEGRMPRGRSKLNVPAHQPKLDALAAWLDAGTPEDEPAGRSPS